MATRNFVPRKTGEGSVGTEKKHWGGAFFDKLAVKTLEVIGGGTENDAQPATVGWVKSKAQELVKNAFATLGVRYNIEENGYLCMGALFGNLKIQWGYVYGGQVTTPDQSILITPLVSISRELFSCGNVSVGGGNADSNWKNNHAIASTIYVQDNKKLNVSSTFFGKAYMTRWLLIGV
jgi:hypothetical protein